MKRLLIGLTALLLSAPAFAQLSIADAPVTTEGGQSCNVISRPTVTNTTASFNYTTVGDTAKAGVDFVAKSGRQSIRKKTKQITICFSTIDNNTFQNDRRFFVTITPLYGLTAVRHNATNVIRDNEVAPPPVGTNCPDGSVVFPPEICPVTPPPPTGWIVVPLNGASYARAVKTCNSIYRTAETDRVGISYRSVLAGTVYSLVPPNVWGSSPSWGWVPIKNIDGQTGNVWTVTQTDNPLAWATVAQECLEGVKQG